VLDRLAVLGEPLLEPRDREHQRGPLPLQPAGELGDERVGQRRVRLDHLGEHEDHAGRRRRGGREHALDPAGGALAVTPPGGDAGGDAAQVLDEREAQHDRDGPQLAERQRLDRLVGRDERPEALAVDPAVRVRDELERDVVDPRRARRGPVGEPRQLAGVAPRQVAPRRPDLLLDERVVVDEPLGRGRDARAGRGGRGDQPERVAQDHLVGREPEQQAIDPAAAGGRELVPARQAARVLLELADAEQLGAQRLLVGGRRVAAVGQRGRSATGRGPRCGVAQKFTGAATRRSSNKNLKWRVSAPSMAANARTHGWRSARGS
jgi:hypothetical protein